MDYQEIISAYKSQKLDISDLKNKLEEAKMLTGRQRFRTVYLSGKNIDFNTTAVNLLRTPENTEKVETFYNDLENLLNDYFNTIIYLIKTNKSWKFMKLSPQDYSLPKYNGLDILQKFNMLEELNKKYSEYINYQKLADIRDYIKLGSELKDSDINNILFIQLMFNNIDNNEIKREFYCFDKKFLMALIEYKKSKVKRLDEFMKTKKKNIETDYEKYSLFFNTEDYRDISESIVLTSKTLKNTISFIIGAFYEISETESEEYYINEEYVNLTALKEKFLIMSKLGIKLHNKRKMQQKEKEKIEETQKKILQLKLKQNDLAEEKKKQDEELEAQKQEDIIKLNEIKTVNSINAKEQVNPLIFSWLEREDITLTRRVGSKNLVVFFDKIKQIEEETGIKVSLFLVTNTSEEITLRRLQEFQKKARTNGLPDLVEGALGGYSSFRIDKNGNTSIISIMSEDNRNKIIKLLERPVRFYLPKEIIDETERNYLRYQFTTKRDSTVTKSFLSNCISKILTDENIKKQPLQFLPYIEKDLAGIDVLLSSQLEGLKQLPEYYKSKYEIAPGKTLRVNIDTVNEFNG